MLPEFDAIFHRLSVFVTAVGIVRENLRPAHFDFIGVSDKINESIGKKLNCDLEIYATKIFHIQVRRK